MVVIISVHDSKLVELNDSLNYSEILISAKRDGVGGAPTKEIHALSKRQ